jgi:hypothetical protein
VASIRLAEVLERFDDEIAASVLEGFLHWRDVATHEMLGKLERLRRVSKERMEKHDEMDPQAI